MRRRVVAAILASSSDALLPWGGTTRLRSIAHEICAGPCEKVAVVLGESAGAIAGAVEGLPIATVPNVLWSEGVASAIRCAVAWALRSGADGLLLVEGDQARLDRAHVERLVTAFCATRSPVASYGHDDLGLPAVFGVETFARLGHLTGAHDAREVLRTTPIVKVIPWSHEPVTAVIEVPTAIPELPSSPVVLVP